MASLHDDRYFDHGRFRMSCGFGLVCEAIAARIVLWSHNAIDIRYSCCFFRIPQGEMPASQSFNTTILIVALVAIGIDGSLKFKGSDHGFRATNSAR